MKCTLACLAAACLAQLDVASAIKLRDDATRASSRALDRQLFLAASALKQSPTKDMLTAFRLCAPCQHYERFGEAHDGGYVMCTDGLESGLVGAYSYGINGFDGWGTDMSNRFHIPVNEYDCTNPNRPIGGDLRFHGECVKSVNDVERAPPRFKTMTQQIAESGNDKAANGTLLLKMDIEAAEWPILAEEPISTLQKFREIVLEFHWLDRESSHPLYLAALKNLEKAGFVPTHLHGNNNGGMARFGDYSIPNVLEVTYIPKPPGGCAAGVPYRLALDSPNAAGGSELPDAALP